MGRVIGVVNALWDRSGPRIFVHNVGPGAFLLCITNPRTRELLLRRNLWHIAGRPMFVTKWFPEFTREQPHITSAPVGIELRGVPYLLFNKQSPSRIVTAVGKPIAISPETKRKENFEVAKLTVRVNLLKELPTKIVFGFSNGREFEISVSYPWLPVKCEDCNVYGHYNLHCSRKP